MARYYYKDPLKAAWMMQEFGFKFYANYEQGKAKIETIQAIPVWIENELVVTDYKLLEPQVGDLYKYTDQQGFCHVSWVYDIYDLNCDKGKVCNEHYHTGIVPDEIIQREGKAWFTPEVEGD